MERLRTPRLDLEPITTRHAPLLYPGFDDPLLYRYIPQEPPASVEELRRRFRVLQGRASPDGSQAWLNWALLHRNDRKYVGLVEVTVVREVAHLAYFVFSAAAGRGFAREGCLGVVAHLFDRHPVTRITAEIDTRNIASQKVVLSLGFTRVATVRNADYFKGASSDEFAFELHEPDFRVEEIQRHVEARVRPRG